MNGLEHLLDELPALLRDWAGRIGFEAAMALAEHYGGVQLYVPTVEHLTPDHPIARTIGMEAAAHLAEHAGGQRYLIPMAVKTFDRLLDCAILEDLESGLSVRDVALKRRVHERRVYRIKAKRDADAIQPGLFDET